MRRLCEAALFVSVTILLLYAWARFIPTGYILPIGLEISDVTAALAALATVISFIFCLWLPKDKNSLIANSVYIMTVAVVSLLIATSGGMSSPFVSSWILVAVFAGFFGIKVSAGLIGLLIIQIIIVSTQKGFEFATVTTHLLFGSAPLALSFILWHRKPTKRNEKSLTDLAHHLSAVEGKSDVVINSIDDGVMAINRSGVIDLINPSAQTLVGWDKGDALGLDWRSVLKLVSEDGREVSEIDNPVSKALASNKPAHDDKFYLMTQSGKKRLTSIVCSPVGTGSDGVIVVFRDITKEKADEREQAEFISTASHEMRTPVASIEGYLGLALNPATANIDDKARDFITKAHESARYLGRLFQDLLDISKAEEGRLKNEPKIIDVSATTSNIFESLSHLAKEKNLRYFFKPNPTLETNAEKRLQPVFYAEIDPHHFREIVSNLIENAIKYTPQGDVTIDITGDEKLVTISVQDTGIGIPAEDIPHLFQKFYRVDNSDTREIGGTGLGLFLCRRLTEIIGGHLRVESVYQRGSTFFLDIPRTSHDEAMRKLQEATEEVTTISGNRQELVSPQTPIIDSSTPPIEPTVDTSLPQPQKPEYSVPINPIGNFSEWPQSQSQQNHTALTIADLEASVSANQQNYQNPAISSADQNTDQRAFDIPNRN